MNRQRAGSNSHQIQVAGDYVVVQGVTEERALEIATEAARGLIDEYAAESQATAAGRIDSFNTKLIGQLEQLGKLDSLADPGMQVQLRRAQLEAASTESEVDHEMLAGLLSQRAEADTRPLRAAVRQAVEVVDAIDESALQGLTLSWVVLRALLHGRDANVVLDGLDEFLGRLPLDQLPRGSAWLDHLDMLNLVRPGRNGLSSLKKLSDYYADVYPAFVSPGIDPGVEQELNEEIKALLGRGLEFVDHPWVEGRRATPFFSREKLRMVLEQHGRSAEDITAVTAAMEPRGLWNEGDEQRERLRDEIHKRPVLSGIAAWWDEIPMGFQHTAAGIAVAYSNAGRFFDVSPLGRLEDLLAV